MRSIFPANFSNSDPITRRLSPQMSLFFQPSSKVSPSLCSQISNSVDCFGVFPRVAMLILLFLYLLRGSASVDGLNDLEGQAHPRYLLAGAIFVVLSWPDQLDPGHAPHTGWLLGQGVVGFLGHL